MRSDLKFAVCSLLKTPGDRYAVVVGAAAAVLRVVLWQGFALTIGGLLLGVGGASSTDSSHSFVRAGDGAACLPYDTDIGRLPTWPRCFGGG